DPADLAERLSSASGPAAAVDAIIDGVLDGPATDNATAIVIDVEWQVSHRRSDTTVDDDVTGPRPPVAALSPLIDAVPTAPLKWPDERPADRLPISEVPA